MTITGKSIAEYADFLRSEERSGATVEKYLRSLKDFARWLDGRELTRESAIAWKEQLDGATATINGAISAVNGFLGFLGIRDWRLKHLKVQHRAYRSAARELTQKEYERLVQTAMYQGKERLALAIETICACGIRVSELKAVTLEALREREITICNKGKTRTIMMPKKLAVKLSSYARRQGIRRGEIFVTRSGRSLSRTQLWAEMKALCRAARVEPAKVFPHNLRHLFAVVYYRLHWDIAKLADLLGHSSIDTTRIYLATSGKEHQRQLEAMRLVF